MKRLAVPPLICLSLLSAGSVSASADDGDDRDHEIARKALSKGHIRPLTEIIDTLKSGFPGQIIGVELESKKNGTFVYEFKVLAPDGKLKEVKVDAVTAKILKIEDDD
ncbi:MAG: PepSY domain-containing protein [Hyphomicrobium sp.]|uniref:PepSY domain-containing protein n=1 Tax=Hyphomicrobium sp. TaxID=82 RepID=UPI0039E46553